MPVASTIKFGDGLTVTDEGSGTIKVDAGGPLPATYWLPPVTVNNSATLTSFLNQNVPSSALTTKSRIRGHLSGWLLSTTTATPIRLVVSMGGTVLYEHTTGSVTVFGNPRPFVFDFTLTAQNSLTSWFFDGTFFMPNANAPTTGYGVLNAVMNQYTVFTSADAVTVPNTTVDVSLATTTAAATNTLTSRSAGLEVVG